MFENMIYIECSGTYTVYVYNLNILNMSVTGYKKSSVFVLIKMKTKAAATMMTTSCVATTQTRMRMRMQTKMRTLHEDELM